MKKPGMVARSVFIVSVVMVMGALLILRGQVVGMAPLVPDDDAFGLADPTPAYGAEPSSLASEAELLLIAALEEAGGELSLHQMVVSEDQAITVCLTVPADLLAQQDWLGVDAVSTLVRRALTPLSWRALSVLALDRDQGICRAISDFAPRAALPAPVKDDVVPDVEAVPALSFDAVSGMVERQAGGAAQEGALTGKTVYLSAGHGWYWNGWAWRTQRIEYQGFIEDHNNAEVVTQYLIPYLENAGATVISAREYDWNTANVVVDNDGGAPGYVEEGRWTTSGSPGFRGGTYRYATTVAGTATATATWTLQVPEDGNYALYAWFYPSTNRTPDAHYTVHHAGGVSTVVLDQRVQPKTWRTLGTFPFEAGTTLVTLDNRSQFDTTTAVIADALRLGGGQFDTFDDLQWLATTDVLPGAPPDKPWWETSSFYFAQRMGLDLSDAWIPYFNDVVARPIYARWHERANPGDAVFISWHTNGYDGSARGTVSYVHNSTTYPQTPGSTDLQRAVHDELVNDIRGGWDAAWLDRGKRAANLGEIRMLWDEEQPEARIPGVLLEIAFHDNAEDADALKEPLFNQLSARAVYQGIVKYFEGRDGVNLTLLPEPPTHLRVQNAGAGRVRVAWSPSPVDAHGVVGDAATAYHVYTSTDGFGWGEPALVAGTAMTLTGLAEGAPVYVRVTGVNSGGESLPTEVLGATVGEAPLLIVNGFDKINRFGLVQEEDPVEGENLRMWLDQINSRDYVVHHGEAMPPGYAWDSASNEAVGAGDLPLDPYRVIDWILGEESLDVDGTLNAAERTLVRDYLDAGGSLLISGSELAWDMAAQGRDPTFLHDDLYTEYVGDDAGTYMAQPVPGGAFEGLGTIYFDAPGEYDADHPDILAPRPGAVAALTYAGGEGGVAAVQVAEGCSRQLTLGFPFEVVRATSRASLMQAAIAFLDHCPAAGVTMTSPRDGGLYQATPSFSGTLDGAAGVEVEVRREQDGLYWDGGMWGEEVRWLSATSTVTWSYNLPELADGLYRVRARAVASSALPDEATFQIDGTAPLAPAVVMPTTGSIVPDGVVTLVWAPPEDTGSSLVYEVEVDGALFPRTAMTSTSVSLGVAMHTWRVRALDAAGNTGPWSPLHTFAAVCATCGVVDTVITAPRAGAMVTTTPVFEGYAVGLDLRGVQIALVHRSDEDLYWDGSGWLWGEAHWLTATGQLTDSGALMWHYPLPALMDGAYTVYARAVGDDVDACPAQITFWVDGTPPAEPVVVGPSSSMVVMGIAVDFSWSEPSGEQHGTPLRYDVAVDDGLYATTGTTLTLRLGIGQHQWRVRALDGAGNVGPWSAWHYFDLDAYQAFLPLAISDK